MGFGFAIHARCQGATLLPFTRQGFGSCYIAETDLIPTKIWKFFFNPSTTVSHEPASFSLFKGTDFYLKTYLSDVTTDTMNTGNLKPKQSVQPCTRCIRHASKVSLAKYRSLGSMLYGCLRMGIL